MQLIAEEACQIRHTALEAARISINRKLLENVGAGNYFLQIRPYPHQVIREHKMATGAGADRISSGMRMAFGKPVGTAARVHPGEIIMVGKVDRGSAKTMKDALKKASIKLPTPCKVIVTKGKEITSKMGL